MNEPIFGTFMLRPMGEGDDETTATVMIGPLSFDDTMARLTADYGLELPDARQHIINAMKRGTEGLVSAVTRQGVQVIYSP